MSIVIGRPTTAKKELICRGDEATVSRVMGGRFKSMVERLQDSSRLNVPDNGGLQMFKITHPASRTYGRTYFSSSPNGSFFPNNHVMYPVFQFLSLRAANLLFPGNFISPQELRLSKKGSDIISAMYSPFVPDDSERVKRTEYFREKFYGKHLSKEERASIRISADSLECRLCPGLDELVDAVQRAGITVAHPEANYQVSNNKIVFFEIAAFDLVAASIYLEGAQPDNLPAREMLALIHMVLIKQLASFVRKYHNNPSWHLEDWTGITLKQLMGVFSNDYGRIGTDTFDFLQESASEIVKSRFPFPEYKRLDPGPVPYLPVKIDERVFHMV